MQAENIHLDRAALTRAEMSTFFRFQFRDHLESSRKQQDSAKPLKNLVKQDRITMRSTLSPKKDFSSPSSCSQAFKLQPGKLFVGGLSRDTTEDGLQSFFSRKGKLIDWVIMRDKQTMHSRGFGFVTFTDPAVAQALALERHVDIEGRKVEIKLATPKDVMDSVGSSSRTTPQKMSSESQQTSPASVASTNQDQDRFSPDNISAQRKCDDSFKTSKIFIRRLPLDADEEDLRIHFERYGDIWSCQVMRDKEGNPRGFGYVTFTSEKFVDKAVQHNHTILGLTVEVKKAIPKRLMEARGEETSPSPDVASAAPTPATSATVSRLPLPNGFVGPLTHSVGTSPSQSAQSMRRGSSPLSSLALGSPQSMPLVSPIGTPLFHSVNFSSNPRQTGSPQSPILQQPVAMTSAFQQLPPQHQRPTPRAQQQLNFGSEPVSAVWDSWGSKLNGVFSGGSGGVWSGGLQQQQQWNRYSPSAQMENLGSGLIPKPDEYARSVPQHQQLPMMNTGLGAPNSDSLAVASGLSAYDLERLGVVDTKKLRMILNGAIPSRYENSTSFLPNMNMWNTVGDLPSFSQQQCLPSFGIAE